MNKLNKSVAVFCVAIIKLHEELYLFSFDCETWKYLLRLLVAASRLTDDLKTSDAMLFNNAPKNCQEFVSCLRQKSPFNYLDLENEILVYNTLLKFIS